MSHFFTRNDHLLLSCLVFILIVIAKALNSEEFHMQNEPKRCKKCSVSAHYIFGDSTADSGSNNYIMTRFKANFLPYGKDFMGGKATGRFSNGRLFCDFVSEYFGFDKYPPPYLSIGSSIEDASAGVNFASAATGFDSLTPILSNVISIPTQLKYFRTYKTKLESKIGKEKTEEHMKKAFFSVTGCTNDFVVNYFGIGRYNRPMNFTLRQFKKHLIHSISQFIHSLVDEGARRIGIASLPPIGCIPGFFNEIFQNDGRGCNATFNSIAEDFNQMLYKELQSLQKGWAYLGVKIAYFDAYTPLLDMVASHKYGFEEVTKGCCGMFATSLLCDPASIVCSDTSKYVFYDAIHPTETAYKIIFDLTLPTIDSLVVD